jgi:hypothetical protein
MINWEDKSESKQVSHSKRKVACIFRERGIICLEVHEMSKPTRLSKRRRRVSFTSLN